MFRKVILALIVAIGLAVLGLLAVPHIGHQHLILTTCFTQLLGVEVGAKVRMQGVEIGTVRAVNVQLGDKSCPAKLDLDLWLPKGKHVPRDARTELSTAGVLGPTYVVIDTAMATGPPVETGDSLQSTPTAELSSEGTEKAVRTLSDRLGKLLAGAQGPCFAPDNRCVIHVKSPDYPESARRARVTGIVVVRADIDKDGKNSLRNVRRSPDFKGTGRAELQGVAFFARRGSEN